jgi:hypothetical protein
MEPNTPSSAYLHALDIYPDVSFESQGTNETVVLVLRAHPITQIIWIFNTIVFFILLGLLNLWMVLFLDVRQIVFSNVFGFFLIFAYAWYNFIHWYYNVGIVTNERALDVELSNAIYKEVAGARLEKVSETITKEGGYFGSIFNYGDVFVKTEGSNPNIEFLDVPAPSQVLQIINDLLAKIENK